MAADDDDSKNPVYDPVTVTTDESKKGYQQHVLYIHTYVHTCIHTYTHAYIHTHTHTHIHRCAHIYIYIPVAIATSFKQVNFYPFP